MRNLKSAPTIAEIEARRAELVFAFVAPVGVNAYRVAEAVKSQLLEFGYVTVTVRISDQFEALAAALDCEIDLSHENEVQRIEKYMEAGNKLCKASGRNDLLALSAVEQINKARGGCKPIGTAYLVLSVKRPKEIELLRQVYGVGLYVFGISASEDQRIRYLKIEKQASATQAKNLMRADRDDGKLGGQRTGDAYHQSDVFIDIGVKERDWTAEVGRVLDLIFSHPYHTPTRDEYAMFLAFGAGVRSAQFGRQVGASIFDPQFELLGLGCNEVPMSGGGQYWSGDDVDDRDHIRQIDSNDQHKNDILKDILDALPTHCSGDEASAGIRATSLFNITEFGRAVHAEMEAILSCVRKGISSRGSTLYSTVFPCHNCARHIIGAGIAKVVYIEPYPKSRATDLHDDVIRTKMSGDSKGVPFVSFIGVAPRRYLDMFSTKPLYGFEIDRKLKDGSGRAIPWVRNKTQLRSPMGTLAYLQREDFWMDDLLRVFDKKEKKKRI